MKPHHWQQPNIERVVAAVTRHGCALDTSDTGTGKTVMSLFAARTLRRRPLVVCPKALVPQWADTARKIGSPHGAAFVGYEKLTRGTNPYGRWKRRHTEKSAGIWEWDVPPNTVLIYDEARRLTGLKSATARTLVAARRQGIPVVMLSATLADSPLHLKAPGYALGLHDLDSFWFWARDNGCWAPPYGGLEFSGGPTHMEAIRRRLGIRCGGVRVSDLGGAFPGRTISTLMLPGGAGIDDAADDYITNTPTKDLTEATFMHATRAAREAAEMEAAEHFKGIAKDNDTEGVSSLFFFNYRAPAQEFADAVGCPLVIGDQDPARRQAAVDAFQSNKATTLALTTGAGGEGLNLHDLHGRPRSSYIIPGFRADHVIQALGRTHRDGALSPSTNHVVFFADSDLDKSLADKVSRKVGNISTLNNSDFFLPNS